MTVAAFALIVLACVAMVVVHVRTQRRLEQSLIDRHKALDKQAKVFVRELQRTHRAAAKSIDQSRALQDDTRQLHGVMDAFIREMHERGWAIDGR